MKIASARQSGFTLIELMVTLVLGAIILTIAVPSFRTFVQDTQLTTTVNEMVTDINLTRSEGVKNGAGATLCKRNGGGTACDSSAAWDAGWIVFADTDRDGVVDAGETLLRVHEPLLAELDVTFTPNRITYDSRGAASGFSGTIVVCDARGAGDARGLILSNTGRLRRAQDSNSNGTEEDGSGNELTCP